MKILAVTLLLVSLVLCHEHIETWLEDTTFEIAWQTPIDRDEYVPSKNIITNFKLWKNNFYLAIPRWDFGIPVTLGVVAQPNGTKLSYNPYPNLDIQKIGNCNALQSVRSIEIDPKGRMWVLDSGKAKQSWLLPNNIVTCSSRLVILDLENDGAVLHTHEFSKQLTSESSYNLDDIVLDHESGGFAYISDNTENDPGIIVFSLRQSSSWKIRREQVYAESEMFYLDRKSTKKAPYFLSVMALSPGNTINKFLYYVKPLSSNIYKISVEVLRNSSINYLDPHLTPVIEMSYETFALGMSADELLYYGPFVKPAIGKLDITTLARSAEIFPRDGMSIRNEAFAFDEYDYLWAMVGFIDDYGVKKEINVERKYQIYRMKIHAKSYQYNKDGEIPIIPEITNKRINYSTSTISTTTHSDLLDLVRNSSALVNSTVKNGMDHSTSTIFDDTISTTTNLDLDLVRNSSALVNSTVQNGINYSTSTIDSTISTTNNFDLLDLARNSLSGINSTVVDNSTVENRTNHSTSTIIEGNISTTPHSELLDLVRNSILVNSTVPNQMNDSTSTIVDSTTSNTVNFNLLNLANSSSILVNSTKANTTLTVPVNERESITPPSFVSMTSNSRNSLTTQSNDVLTPIDPPSSCTDRNDDRIPSSTSVSQKPEIADENSKDNYSPNVFNNVFQFIHYTNMIPIVEKKSDSKYLKGDIRDISSNFQSVIIVESRVGLPSVMRNVDVDEKGINFGNLVTSNVRRAGMNLGRFDTSSNVYIGSSVDVSSVTGIVKPVGSVNTVDHCKKETP